MFLFLKYRNGASATFAQRDRWHSGSTGVAFLRKYASAKLATRRGRRKGKTI
jgi:hypothetical protein